jgi:hypothetical protein
LLLDPLTDGVRPLKQFLPAGKELLILGSDPLDLLEDVRLVGCIHLADSAQFILP